MSDTSWSESIDEMSNHSNQLKWQVLYEKLEKNNRLCPGMMDYPKLQQMCAKLTTLMQSLECLTNVLGGGIGMKGDGVQGGSGTEIWVRLSTCDG